MSSAWPLISSADLLTLALQTALLLLVGLSLPDVLRLRDAAWRARFWWALMLLCLMLPLGRSIEAPQLTFGAEIVVQAGALLGASETPRTDGPLSLTPLLTLWLCGVGARLTWLALGTLTLRRWRRQASPLPVDPAIETARRQLVRWAETPAMASTPFLSSPHVPSPVTFGLWQPVVMVPDDFHQQDAELRQAVALHELVHVERRDAWRQLGEELLRALLWFHPAFWCLLPRIRLCREQLVDQRVVEHMHRRPYLEAVCHYAAGTAAWPPAPALSWSQPSHLRQRVATILQEIPMSRSQKASALAVLTGLVALTAVLAVSLFPWSPVYADKERIYKVEGDVRAPVRIYGPAPSYPEGIDKEERQQGTVVIQATIDRQGKVSDQLVTKSLDKAYDQAAMEAISQWRFEPATLDGQAVPVFYNLTVNFRLE